MVIETVLASRNLQTEVVPLGASAGRVLARMVLADRDYPPVSRSIRDGFAVRSADLPGSLEVVGEVRAGAVFDGEVGPRQCVEIMTGASMPRGADAVVMVEYTAREGSRMTSARSPRPGEFVNAAGAEARQGMAVLPAGVRIGFAQVAMLASVGMTEVPVFRKPRVAILSTGDEVIPVEQTPLPYQVRNSNAWAVAVQVAEAGGEPEILPVAPDDLAGTRRLIEQGLERDLLLLSGGVSAGKYDFVEPALAGLDAEFLFDRVLIQPGQPLVFGRARGKCFFGLPGNPASSMVTFKTIAAAAVELSAGLQTSDLRMPRLRLTSDFHHKSGLTRFLPARVNEDATEVTPIPWQGSSDVAALARANAFLVVDSERESWRKGDEMGVIFS